MKYVTLGVFISGGTEAATRGVLRKKFPTIPFLQNTSGRLLLEVFQSNNFENGI